MLERRFNRAKVLSQNLLAYLFSLTFFVTNVNRYSSKDVKF